jgi:hypothetical protein
VEVATVDGDVPAVVRVGEMVWVAPVAVVTGTVRGVVGVPGVVDGSGTGGVSGREVVAVVVVVTAGEMGGVGVPATGEVGGASATVVVAGLK